MPIYEFRCTRCGESFDVMRPRDNAGDPASCPKDGADGQRLFTSAIAVSRGGADDFDMAGMEEAMAGMGGMDGMPGMGGMPDMGGMDDFDF